MIDVERVPGELLILGKINICFGGGFIVAAAGQAPTGQLFNPADSGIIATVSSFTIAINGISTIGWGRTNTPVGAAIGTETFRDTRHPLTEAPVCDVRQVSAVAVGSGTNQARVANGDTFSNSDENGVIVLAPGTGFDVGSQQNAQTLFYSFYWRERVAEPSELNF